MAAKNAKALDRQTRIKRAFSHGRIHGDAGEGFALQTGAVRPLKDATPRAAWCAARVFFAVVSSMGRPANVVDVVHARSHGMSVAVGAAGRYGYVANAADVTTDAALVPVLPDGRAELGDVVASARVCAYVATATLFCGRRGLSPPDAATQRPPPLTRYTPRSLGAVARLTALISGTALPRAFVSSERPFVDVGLVVVAVACLRLVGSVAQPRPAVGGVSRRTFAVVVVSAAVVVARARSPLRRTYAAFSVGRVGQVKVYGAPSRRTFASRAQRPF